MREVKMKRQDSFRERELLPEGEYEFDIMDEPVEVERITGNPLKWFFKSTKGKEWTPLLFPFGNTNYRTLLLALGFEERYDEDGKKCIDWDTQEVVGRRFKCEIYHNTFTTKAGIEKTVEAMTNIEEI